MILFNAISYLFKIQSIPSIIRLFGEDGNEFEPLAMLERMAKTIPRPTHNNGQRLFHWAHWEFEFTAEDEEEGTGGRWKTSKNRQKPEKKDKNHRQFGPRRRMVSGDGDRSSRFRGNGGRKRWRSMRSQDQRIKQERAGSAKQRTSRSARIANNLASNDGAGASERLVKAERASTASPSRIAKLPKRFVNPPKAAKTQMTQQPGSKRWPGTCDEI